MSTCGKDCGVQAVELRSESRLDPAVFAVQLGVLWSGILYKHHDITLFVSALGGGAVF